MKNLKQLCAPRKSVFDVSKHDTVLNLTHLTDDKISAAEFFEENSVTEGMRTLLIEAHRRLQGKSSQAVFKLTQAMGGGKTHNLIALGLLAKTPKLRPSILKDLPGAKELPSVKVIAFSGRETDIALTENPVTHRVSDQPTVPEFFRLVSQHQAAGESLPGYLLEKPEREYGKRKPRSKTE